MLRTVAECPQTSPSSRSVVGQVDTIPSPKNIERRMPSSPSSRSGVEPVDTMTSPKSSEYRLPSSPPSRSGVRQVLITHSPKSSERRFPTSQPISPSTLAGSRRSCASKEKVSAAIAFVRARQAARGKVRGAAAPTDAQGNENATSAGNAIPKPEPKHRLPLTPKGQSHRLQPGKPSSPKGPPSVNGAPSSGGSDRSTQEKFFFDSVSPRADAPNFPVLSINTDQENKLKDLTLPPSPGTAGRRSRRLAAARRVKSSPRSTGTPTSAANEGALSLDPDVAEGVETSTDTVNAKTELAPAESFSDVASSVPTDVINAAVEESLGAFIDSINEKKTHQQPLDEQVMALASSSSSDLEREVDPITLNKIASFIDSVNSVNKAKNIAIATQRSGSDDEDIAIELPDVARAGIAAFIDSLLQKKRPVGDIASQQEIEEKALYISGSDNTGSRRITPKNHGIDLIELTRSNGSSANSSSVAEEENLELTAVGDVSHAITYSRVSTFADGIKTDDATQNIGSPQIQTSAGDVEGGFHRCSNDDDDSTKLSEDDSNTECGSTGNPPDSDEVIQLADESARSVDGCIHKACVSSSSLASMAKHDAMFIDNESVPEQSAREVAEVSNDNETPCAKDGPIDSSENAHDNACEVEVNVEAVKISHSFLNDLKASTSLELDTILEQDPFQSSVGDDALNHKFNACFVGSQSDESADPIFADPSARKTVDEPHDLRQATSEDESSYMLNAFLLGSDMDLSIDPILPDPSTMRSIDEDKNIEHFLEDRQAQLVRERLNARREDEFEAGEIEVDESHLASHMVEEGKTDTFSDSELESIDEVEVNEHGFVNVDMIETETSIEVDVVRAPGDASVLLADGEDKVNQLDNVSVDMNETEESIEVDFFCITVSSTDEVAASKLGSATDDIFETETAIEVDRLRIPSDTPIPATDEVEVDFLEAEGSVEVDDVRTTTDTPVLSTDEDDEVHEHGCLSTDILEAEASVEQGELRLTNDDRVTSTDTVELDRNGCAAIDTTEAEISNEEADHHPTLVTQFASSDDIVPDGHESILAMNETKHSIEVDFHHITVSSTDEVESNKLDSATDDVFKFETAMKVDRLRIPNDTPFPATDDVEANEPGCSPVVHCLEAGGSVEVDDVRTTTDAPVSSTDEEEVNEHGCSSTDNLETEASVEQRELRLTNDARVSSTDTVDFDKKGIATIDTTEAEVSNEEADPQPTLVTQFASTDEIVPDWNESIPALDRASFAAQDGMGAKFVTSTETHIQSVDGDQMDERPFSGRDTPGARSQTSYMYNAFFVGSHDSISIDPIIYDPSSMKSIHEDENIENYLIRTFTLPEGVNKDEFVKVNNYIRQAETMIRNGSAPEERENLVKCAIRDGVSKEITEDIFLWLAQVPEQGLVSGSLGEMYRDPTLSDATLSNSIATDNMSQQLNSLLASGETSSQQMDEQSAMNEKIAVMDSFIDKLAPREGAPSEEIDRLNTLMKVTASVLSGKALSEAEEAEVRAAAGVVGISEMELDQVLRASTSLLSAPVGINGASHETGDLHLTETRSSVVDVQDNAVEVTFESGYSGVKEQLLEDLAGEDDVACWLDGSKDGNNVDRREKEQQGTKTYKNVADDSEESSTSLSPEDKLPYETFGDPSRSLKVSTGDVVDEILSPIDRYALPQTPVDRPVEEVPQVIVKEASAAPRDAPEHQPEPRLDFAISRSRTQSTGTVGTIPSESLSPSSARPPTSRRGIDAAALLQRWSPRIGVVRRKDIPVTQHWKLSYKERTKGHFGYFGVNKHSLRETSLVVAPPHLLDDIPWEDREVKQRFLHEHSVSFSRNWFGALSRRRGNDKYREPVARPQSMEMPMSRLPERDWETEWFTTWQSKKLNHINQSQSFESNRGSYWSESTASSDDDDHTGSLLSGSANSGTIRSRRTRESECGSSHDESEDEEGSWEEDEEAPECGYLVNVKQKIGERTSRVHPCHTSSLRRSRWRQKYFPRGTFPYKR